MKNFICVFLVILFCNTAVWAQQPGVAFADKPAVLTSVGQSADLEMVRVLLTRNGINFRADPLLPANGLTADDKTLILVIGGSSKGLGAAGISSEEELRRVQALVNQAKSNNMKIIAIHVGGEGRRGTLSDGFVRFAVPVSDFVIVVSEGDKDGLFTTLANQARIPITKVERISGVGAPLTAAFR